MYVVVVYLSFAVFLVIAIALRTVFVPVIPSTEQLGTAAGSGAGTFGAGISISPISEAQKAHHSLILFHAAIVQAVCSGFVAGQMGEGDVKQGAKHVAIMLAIAYVLALAFG